VIKYLENEHIDKKKWDECIYHSVNARIYAYSWYLTVVAPDWSALILDDYQAVFPIITGNKMGVKYIYQPVFTQQLGLFTPLLLTEELLDKFLIELKSIAPLIQMNLNSHNKIKKGVIEIQKKANHELDLISPYGILKKNYSKNTKRNIKKAEKAELTIFKNLKPETIIELFRSNKGKAVQNLGDADYNKLNHLLYKAIGMNMAEIWGVFTKENSLCAGAVFIKDYRRFIFLFSATNQEAKEYGAMPFLIDSFIEAYAETKTILDFEGSNDPNLARFYKSFGSSLIHYPHIFHNQLPWYISIVWKLKQWIS